MGVGSGEVGRAGEAAVGGAEQRRGITCAATTEVKATDPTQLQPPLLK